MEIQVLDLAISENDRADSPSSKWDLIFVIQPYSSTTIFVNIFMQEHLSLGVKHLPYFFLGLATLILILYELR